MRWGGYTTKGAAMIARLFGVKWILFLATFATLGLLLGSNVKWHG
jgi:hypothetical protein